MSKAGLYGMDNIGNTCYLNTIIQTLSNIKIFREFLLKDDYIPFLLNKLDKESNLNSQIENISNSIIYQFYRLFNILWDPEYQSDSIKPITLKKKLGLKNPMFKNSLQHDVQEVFTMIIEYMHLEIASKINTNIENPSPLENACLNFWAKEYSPIYNIFHGMYLNTKICSLCKDKTENYEPNLFLSLDIPQNISFDNLNISDFINIKCKYPNIIINDSIKNEMCNLIDEETSIKIIKEYIKEKQQTKSYDLSECLSEYYKTKIIEDVFCNNCLQTCNFHVSYELIIAPKILCIQIKRFNSDLSKINNKITYPQILTLNINNNDENYKLCSIINHIGYDVDHGHYHNYTFSSDHEKWFKYDDDDVNEITNNSSKNAYLLFYEKI